jgi:hypothetical protein
MPLAFSGAYSRVTVLNNGPGRASAIELVFRLGWPLFDKWAALLRRITMSRVLTHAAT